MSEDSEIWASVREETRAKRSANRQSSTAILDRIEGLEYVSNNGGVHLIVSYGGKMADFWPSTGKYKFRDQTKYKRGVFNLLRELGATL